MAITVFGMGIDHPQVQLVVHVDELYSIMDFVQEAG
jgi:superfamily II DNA helicase RecQ